MSESDDSPDSLIPGMAESKALLQFAEDTAGKWVTINGRHVYIPSDEELDKKIITEDAGVFTVIVKNKVHTFRTRQGAREFLKDVAIRGSVKNWPKSTDQGEIHP